MWTFLFSPYGRISRKTYWLNWILPYIGITFVAVILDFVLFPIDPVRHEPPPIIQSIVGLFFFWPSIATTTKRLHDRGRTGWWNLAPVVVVIPLAAAAYWYYTAKMTGGAPPDSPIFVVVMVALSLVAFAVMLYLIVNTLFLRGQTGDNKYGTDPLAPSQAEVFA